jgi:hypothetical protein
MPQVVIVSSLGPQGPVGPQGLQGPSGSFDNISGSFVTTASFSAFTQSVNSFTESINAFTASYSTGSFTGSFTGSANLTSFTASDAFVTGNVTVLGTASINTLIVNQTQLSTGSNQLGDAADDTQTLYGTVIIPTGSLTISGSTLTSGSLTVGGNIGLTGDIIQQGVNLDMKISGAQTGRAVKLLTSSTGLRLQAIGSTTSNFTLSTTVSSSETARITILEGGNVGIGTVTPSYTLDISGSLRVGTPTATPHLIFARASNNYITTPVGGAILFNLNNSAAENTSIVGMYSTGLRLGTGFANPSAVAHVRGTGATSATTALLVQNSNASASLTVLDNGYVGIGIAAPLRQLHVVGDIEVTNGIYGDATDHTFYTIASGSFHHRFYTRTSGGTSLERFTIEGGSDTANAYFQNTNLGIGTTAPGVKLEIRATGSNETTQRWLDSAGNLLGDFAEFGDAGVLRLGYVISSISTNRPLLTLDGGGSNTTAAVYLRSKSGTTNVRIASDLPSYISGSNLAVGFISPTASAIIHISGAAADNVFRVDTPTIPHTLFVSGSGNIGIGTSTPDRLVHINSTVGNALRIDNVGGGQNAIFIGNVSSLIRWSNGSYFSNTGMYSVTSDQQYITFDGTNTQVRLQIKASDGNISIGTTGSLARLQVRGSGTTSSTTTLRIENSNTSASLTVLDNGYIGIGTAAPSYSLDVYGSYHQYQVQGLLARYDISSANANQNRGVWDFYTNVAVAPDFFGRFGFKFEGGVSDSFKQYQVHIGDSTTPKFIVDGAGRVAIGTITPSASLHISGSSGSVLLEVDSNSTQNILYVSGSGNVGIGTSTPATSLHTVGITPVRAETPSGNIRAGFEMASAYYGGVGAGTYFYPGGPSAGTNVFGEAVSNLMQTTLFQMATGTMKVGTVGSGNTQLYTNSLPRLTIISSSGNIGIGTTTPSFKFNVLDGSATYVAQFRGSNSSYIIAGDTSLAGESGLNARNSVGQLFLGINPSGEAYFTGTGGATALNFGVASVNAIWVNSSRNVGIGTSGSVSARLHVSGSSNSTLFKVDSDTTTNILFVSGSGNIGIGTNTPSQKLDVDGAILVRSGNGVYFRDTVSYIYEGSGLNIVSGATRNIRLNAGGTDRLFVSASGNVGIGTSTPTATLDILSSSTGSIRISGSAGSQITFVRPTAGLTGFVRYIGTSMDIGTVGSDGLNLYTSNTSRVAIQTNGDVLIGSGATPAGRLEVKGSGTTASTISLRVGNSTPAPSLVITDDLTSRFYGNVGIGALPASGSLHISGAASTSSAAVYIYKSGSTTLDIQGSQGQLFSVTDALSGSLMSVNDISGLPILEVFSDDRVVMGSFSQPALLVTGSAVRFPATASATPTYTGSEGQVVFGVVGGNAFIYAGLGGRWRSGSLA